MCFRQSQACVERMIDAVLDALNKASVSTITPPEAAANLADMLAGLLIRVSSCCYMLYMCPHTIYAANLGNMLAGLDVCVLILLYIYMSSYCCMCVLILYMYIYIYIYIYIHIYVYICIYMQVWWRRFSPCLASPSRISAL